MGQCIYLTDLDDTLFRSSHKHPQGEALTRVTTATNGHHGHMNPAQQGLLSALRATGAVIPVTARSTDAFSRVHLDFGTRRAILANGAVILNAEGVADPAWLAHTAHIGRSAETLLLDMSALIGAELGSAARSWIVEEYGAPVYFCVKMNATGDHYRVGVPMYLHNVPERPGARVIIMTETGDDGICPTLRAYLGRGHIINGAGQVTEFET